METKISWMEFGSDWLIWKETPIQNNLYILYYRYIIYRIQNILTYRHNIKFCLFLIICVS